MYILKSYFPNFHCPNSLPLVAEPIEAGEGIGL